MTVTFGSLFAGIGGIDIGLERAGMTCRWQVEIDPFCRRVLEKHWPDVPRYKDVKCVGRDTLESVDVVCGGFPCQDISLAGKGEGITGARSGLWSEFARIIGEIHPQWVIAENVPALRSRGLVRVLQDLDALGYDAEWHCIPAAAVGAPHQRDRIWIIAYPNTNHPRLEGRDGASVSERTGQQPARAMGSPMADATGVLRNGSDVHGRRYPEGTKPFSESRDGRSATPPGGGWWSTEPDVGRVADGVPNRVDRLKALGNAVVPQVVEQVGRQIMAAA